MQRLAAIWLSQTMSKVVQDRLLGNNAVTTEKRHTQTDIRFRLHIVTQMFEWLPCVAMNGKWECGSFPSFRRRAVIFRVICWCLRSDQSVRGNGHTSCWRLELSMGCACSPTCAASAQQSLQMQCQHYPRPPVRLLVGFRNCLEAHRGLLCP